ncbi:glycosyltransferase family 2 protein [Mycoplana dimorpha]|uniref:Glycosyl transferase family 2 n=1 Tax=Mycoplana dimorpha TaxID=28320 RepID=A0A2T5BE14_MYCDI|nr:glycosyltransferase family A protein [Mycoplana dimorpha]PTM97201.1 glycosyl transferase family 2 [Mycoplana dimorpha]
MPEAACETLRSERAWALYRLGCYRSASALLRSPATGREALALGVSLVASGRTEEGTRLLERARRNRLLRGRNLVQAATAIAAFNPAAAHSLSEAISPASTGLRVALLLAEGREEEARCAARAAIAKGKAAEEPDLYLLLANATAAPGDRLRLVNTFLAAHQLAEVAPIDAARPLSAANLTSRLAAGSVRGPLVTITMPAYNTETRISRSIESLLAQTYRDIEVLVVDDASTDGTFEVVKRLAARDDRVRLMRRDRNGGPYAARNLALAHARGSFVTCQDSDDWAHPEKIARQVRPLLKDGGLVFTLSSWVRLGDEGQFYARQIYPLTRLNPASPLFRREAVLARAGLYEEVRTGADSEYIARLKLIFGWRGWRRLHRPLSFGAHRPGSLMTDAGTGIARGEINRERLDYWEEWTARHIERFARGGFAE